MHACKGVYIENILFISHCVYASTVTITIAIVTYLDWFTNKFWFIYFKMHDRMKLHIRFRGKGVALSFLTVYSHDHLYLKTGSGTFTSSLGRILMFHRDSLATRVLCPQNEIVDTVSVSKFSHFFTYLSLLWLFS